MERYEAGWIELNRAMRAGEPWSGDERNVAFLQGRLADGTLTTVDVAPLFGLDDPGDGRSAARIDIDFDGDEDLVLTSRTGPRVRILQNRLADSADWLGVRLVATSSNPEALGAVVTFEIPGENGAAPRILRRSRRAGSGYLAQSSEWIRAALGRRAAGDLRAPRARVRVRWPGPDGVTEDFGELRAGRSYVLVEASGSARESGRLDGPTVEFAAAPPYVETASERDARNAVLPWPTAIPSFAVRGEWTPPSRIFGLTPAGPRSTGGFVGILVFDSTEDLGALGDLVAAGRAFRESGAVAIALDVAPLDETNTTGTSRVAVTERLRAAGWAGTVLFAAEEETRAILGEVVAWRFDATDVPELPWTLVIRPDGRLAVVRVGPAGEDTMERDLAAARAEDEERLTRLSTFGVGRWIEPPEAADLGPLKTRLARVGLLNAVRELDLARITTEVSDPAAIAVKLGRSMLAQSPPDVAGALDAFERAVALDGASVEAHRGRAFALHLLGRFDEAYAAWSRALELGPDHPESLVNRVLAAVESERFDAAEADIAALEALGESGKPYLSAARRALSAARDDR